MIPSELTDRGRYQVLRPAMTSCCMLRRQFWLIRAVKPGPPGTAGYGKIRPMAIRAGMAQSGGEETFAEAPGNSGVAPIPDVRRAAMEPRGST